nr:unnamed protein product [Spirometra erinaceieuropaei]
MFSVLCLSLLLALSNSAAGNNVCKLPVEPGLCRGFFPSFAYVPEVNRCEKFIYGGCGGNGNRFESLEECQRACGGNSRENRCELPIEAGNCLAYLPHYAFDRRQRKCVRFIYGGCGGNANRFDTLEGCKRACE